MREVIHGESLENSPKREKQARVVEGPLSDADWEAILAAPKLSSWDRKLVSFFRQRNNEFADAYAIAAFMGSDIHKVTPYDIPSSIDGLNNKLRPLGYRLRVMTGKQHHDAYRAPYKFYKTSRLAPPETSEAENWQI